MKFSKQKIKLPLIFLAVILIFTSSVALFTYAEDQLTPTQEYVSNGITWTFYEDTNTLILSGEGDTGDYLPPFNIGFGSNSPIGIFLGHKITNVVVEEGITGLGSFLFYECADIVSVKLPDSLRRIGSMTFRECSLESISIPAGVKEIGSDAFGFCTALKEIRFYGHAPKIFQDSFYYVDATAYYPLNDPTWNEKVLIDYNDPQDYYFTLEPEGSLNWQTWDAPEITDVTHKFIDVTYGSWYVPGIQYAYDNGYLAGTSLITMSPKATVTKSMVFTILYALSGEEVEYEALYPDVPKGKWYGEAVTWAANNSIIAAAPMATGENLYPSEEVSRENIACYLYAYAKNPETVGNLDGFKDAENVSYHAVDAMKWCVDNGVFCGDDLGCLNPQSSTTRAEFATIMKAFTSVVA